MTLRNKWLSAMVMGALTLPVYAANATAAVPGETAVFDYAFAGVDATSVRELSEQELAAVKGDFLPLAALPPALVTALKAVGWGAFFGASAGAIVEAQDKNATASSVAKGAASGAVSGALLNVGGAGGIPIIFRTTAAGLGLGWTSASSAHGRPVVNVKECYYASSNHSKAKC